MNIKNILSIVFLSLLVFSCGSNSEIVNTKLVKKHLCTLASDDMQGRKVGTPGIEKAAKYIESEFKRIGLQVYPGTDSYRQKVNHRTLDLTNMIGYLPGKSKKEEFVVISAHYDHLGISKTPIDGDSIYNGANDDASGVAAVLALAEYFKDKDINERSILFIAFTAEEMGLIGSNFFGTQIIPEHIIAGINIEMIGKESSFGLKTAWISGFDRSDFGKIIQKNIEGSGYKIYPDPYPKFNLFFRSDNASLARLGIPAHSFSTSPADDEDYHKVTDEAESLNIETITETIKAISIGVTTIIDGTDTPTRVILTEKEKKRAKRNN